MFEKWAIGMVPLCTSLLINVACIAAQSSDTLMAGDRQIDVRALVAGEYAIESEMTRAGNITSGTTNHVVRDTVINGKEAYHMLSRSPTAVHHLLVRKADLVPMGFSMRTDRDSAEIAIDGTMVHGWRANASGRENVHVVLKGAPFMEGILPDVIARLPLKVGMEACAYSYHPFTGESCVPLRVVGRGPVDGKPSAPEAWEVESVTETSFGTFTRTWWIAIASGAPIGMRLVGSNGITVRSTVVWQ